MVSDREKERQLVLDFARYFVVDVFEKSFRGRSRPSSGGVRSTLIRDTCEFLYRLEQDKENQSQRDTQEDDQNPVGARSPRPMQNLSVWRSPLIRARRPRPYQTNIHDILEKNYGSAKKYRFQILPY